VVDVLGLICAPVAIAYGHFSSIKQMSLMKGALFCENPIQLNEWLIVQTIVAGLPIGGKGALSFETSSHSI